MAPLRILVVDVEEKIKQVIGMYLKKEGFDLDFASNGREALDKFRTQSWEGV